MNRQDAAQGRHFTDLKGRVTTVHPDDLDEHNLPVFNDPEALTALNDGIEDYQAGRFVEFDF